MRLSPLVLLALAACESGLSIQYTLTVPNELATSRSSEEPGLLRVTDDRNHAVRVLCGQSISEVLEYSVDLGFGCLDDLRDTTEPRTAWIEPVPETWDHAELCSLPEPPNRSQGVSIDPSITGHDGSTFDVLAEEPDETWSQGTAEGTWRRDGSPCGGFLPVEITLR